MIIRAYKWSDCKSLAELFYDTVHTVNAEDYEEEQLNVWADGNVDLEEWNRSFLNHITVVAVEAGMIAGFGDIDRNGYLDRLFVHKDCQRRGIAAAICDMLEKSVDVKIITAHVSVTAKPFFEKRGYKLIREQQIERKEVRLTNYIMEKQKNIFLSDCFFDKYVDDKSKSFGYD